MTKFRAYNSQHGCYMDYSMDNNSLNLDGVVAPTGYCALYRDEDGFYAPKKTRETYFVTKTTPKAPVYKREMFRCKADRYDYAFTENTTEIIRKEKDVYYNSKRNKYISFTKTSKDVSKEFYLPGVFIW